MSADIKQTRRNIRLNVEAWLKTPPAGHDHLFMAGGKHFFVRETTSGQTGIHCDIWMENKLENTDFKAGFAGIRLTSRKERMDKRKHPGQAEDAASMPTASQVNRYHQPEHSRTPTAPSRPYMEPRGGTLLFDFVPWNRRRSTAR